MKLLIILFSFLASCIADELSECKCTEGYKPKQDESGVVYCHGTIVKSILPCNMVIKPDCICNEEATSVLQDDYGTWCTRLVDGKEEKRWTCENKEDWEAFYISHPEEKPKEKVENKPQEAPKQETQDKQQGSTILKS
ncbi:unnamed protein product [Acanthoscelides obtectus]|uniref:Uncharacterized protein n=1 Tax=Acanthoscelides obtectus TaxID=200917 RepID=A0A9P0JK52_ACAOB|nr:unnamed protein product [Acanthoscelides obtectus]CAK1678823.1 hypothetical protein AOBTE_LOCUS32034 [Acanthoscelides obtectus]